MVETLVNIIIVPGAAPTVRPMRPACASTSGSHASQALIDRSAHSRAYSARSSATRAGIAPSECEIMCTLSPSVGKRSRYASSGSRETGLSTMITLVGAVRVALAPLGEQLVAHLPQRREEAVLHR